MDRERDTYAIIDQGTGELLVYPNTYANQEENLEAATRVQNFILEKQQELDRAFLSIGAALKIVRDEEYFLALGHPSLRSWLSGPDFHIGYRLGVDLIRVVEELMPLFEESDLETLPVSKMRELLPLIGTDHADSLSDIVEEISNMTVRDAREHIAEVRGVENENDAPIIFRARVEMGEAFHKVWITRLGGENADIYNLTSSPLRIKPADWARWQQRFGDFIDYEQQNRE